MIVGTLEVLAVLAFVTTLGLLLALMEAPPRNPARYSGSVYDPQRPVIRRAGAVGWTGRKCPLCHETTYGLSDRCGKCGRLNVSVPLVRTEHTARLSLTQSRPSLLASEASPSSRTPDASSPRHDPAATASTSSASSSATAAGSEVTGVGARTRRRSAS